MFRSNARKRKMSIGKNNSNRGRERLSMDIASQFSLPHCRNRDRKMSDGNRKLLLKFPNVGGGEGGGQKWMKGSPLIEHHKKVSSGKFLHNCQHHIFHIIQNVQNTNIANNPNQKKPLPS
jgi:hypothetical protein